MLNISKKILVGWGSTQPGLALASIVASGETKKEQVKLDRFKSKYPLVKEYENLPLPGFTIKGSKRKTTEIIWEVIDPRGFIGQISNKNLESILSVTGITEKLIQQRCVWARNDEDLKLMLLPVTAQEYAISVVNTEIIEQKVPLSEVQIGDEVFLQSGKTGIYRGIVNFYGRIDRTYGARDVMRPVSYIRKQVVEYPNNTFFVHSDIKILRIEKKTDTPWTREQSISYINKHITERTGYFSTWDHVPAASNLAQTITSHLGDVKFASIDAVARPKLVAVPITYDEAVVALKNLRSMGDSSLIVKDKNYYMPSIRYSFPSIHSADINEFSCRKLINIDINDLKTELQIDTPQGLSVTSQLKNKRLSDFSEFFLIQKVVKNNTYI